MKFRTPGHSNAHTDKARKFSKKQTLLGKLVYCKSNAAGTELISAVCAQLEQNYKHIYT